MNELMTGAIAMGLAVAALSFLRFWRQTGDRLFAFFALSFVILAVNRIAFVLLAVPESQEDIFYWIRLTAFVLILVAILDKNRAPSKR
jgi:hypothetical protein